MINFLYRLSGGMSNRLICDLDITNNGNRIIKRSSYANV